MINLLYFTFLVGFAEFAHPWHSILFQRPRVSPKYSPGLIQRQKYSSCCIRSSRRAMGEAEDPFSLTATKNQDSVEDADKVKFEEEYKIKYEEKSGQGSDGVFKLSSLPEEDIEKILEIKEQYKELDKKFFAQFDDFDETYFEQQLSNPTVNYTADNERFAHWFLAVGDIESPDMLEKRHEAWLHHLQWCRRSALHTKAMPEYQNISIIDHPLVTLKALHTQALLKKNETSSPEQHGKEEIGFVGQGMDFTLGPLAEVKWSYTRLTFDRMSPMGQVIAVRANSTQHLKEFFATEPLGCNGGVNWKFFSMDFPNPDGMMDWDVTDPFLFVGTCKPGEKVSAKRMREQLRYHMSAQSDAAQRVCQYAVLYPLEVNGAPGAISCRKGLEEEPLDNSPQEYPFGGKEVGTLILLNSRTNKDANRYMTGDPAVAAGVFTDDKRVSAANIQDVDGLHHLMATNFAMKGELDKFNSMEPEDLLRTPAPELPALQHLAINQVNAALLKFLEDQYIDFKYTRLDMRNIMFNSDDPVFERNSANLEDFDEDDDYFDPADGDDYDEPIEEVTEAQVDEEYRSMRRSHNEALAAMAKTRRRIDVKPVDNDDAVTAVPTALVEEDVTASRPSTAADDTPSYYE